MDCPSQADGPDVKPGPLVRALINTDQGLNITAREIEQKGEP